MPTALLPRALAVALSCLAACERGRATEIPQVRLEPPQDADGDYPPTCGELGPATCTAPCSQGDAAACLHLAEGHLEGAGVPRDPARAIALMRNACDDGFARACGYLAAAIGRQDLPQAKALATTGCERGYGGACVWMAARVSAAATPPDWREAAQWLARGCAAKHPQACLLYGDLLHAGAGVRRDPDGAEQAWRTACDHGAEPACALAEGLLPEVVLHALLDDNPSVAQLRERGVPPGHWRVQVDFCVGTSGVPKVNRVDGGPESLRTLVRETVERWRFTPQAPGSPAPCSETTIEFQLG
ncbi:MAG: sel1 repeat family protein [Nannocystaceae bacterium]|nr:sel1 repeat family protein [Nannocystaceae bacterium]